MSETTPETMSETKPETIPETAPEPTPETMPENPITRSLSSSESNEFPQHILLEHILPKLPAKTLVRFKAVCSKWRTTIETPEFARAHVLQHPNIRSVISIDYCSSFTALNYEDYPNLDFTEFKKRDKDAYKDESPYIVESCNGLLLLICSKDEPVNKQLPDHLLYFRFYFVVYNPFLGPASSIKIDPPDNFLLRTERDDAKDYNFGFGYSFSRDDYFIVAVNSHMIANPDIIVHLYSLQFTRPRWIRIDISRRDDPIIEFAVPWYNLSGILINELLHWPVNAVTSESRQKMIAVFDWFGLDQFKTMPLPREDFGESDEDDDRSAFSLCCLNDCLCAWASYNDRTVVEMWMMKKYGIDGSWTRLFRLDMSGFLGVYYGITNFFGFNRSEMALILSYTDELMLAELYLDPPVYKPYKFEEQVKAVNYDPSFMSPLLLSLSQDQD
ncbi:F-box/kelch-repeat protein At3g23880-like [Chenopodium quinoa]|uniref:F-box/kelch-repeat protein At3g23880-like n=1 Tax=Chenopodium quinoa TaxID=63459 RepID=UPI000B76E366|nr:F-box/kelch-repeat protein At3g23880-like [Chenopodium quinoa]